MDTTNWTVEDHINWMRNLGAQSRYMGEVALNVKVTTMVHYDIPWMKGFQSNHDLVEVTNKYRAMGVIR